MANKVKKPAVKKKATPVKKKTSPAAKKAKPAVKPAPKKAKKVAPAPKKVQKTASSTSKSAKPVKAAAKTTAPAKTVKGKPEVKTAVPVKKPAAPVKPAEKIKPVVKAGSAETKAPKKENKSTAVQPVMQKTKPGSQAASATPAEPENEVIHIVKHGPPPPELKAQFNALKKKKLPPGEKRVVKTEVVNPHVIRDVQMAPEKVAKKTEPKGKFTLEFLFRVPVTLLYDFLTTPSGLVEWFAEEVDLKNDIYTFNWDGAIQRAQIVSAKLDSHIRLRWIDKGDGTYLEFRIIPDEMTGQLALMVTDFGESEDDIVTLRQLWETQITRLMKCLGSY